MVASTIEFLESRGAHCTEDGIKFGRIYRIDLSQWHGLDQDLAFLTTFRIFAYHNDPVGR